MGIECWIPKQNLAFAPEPRWQAKPAVEEKPEPETPAFKPSFSGLMEPAAQTQAPVTKQPAQQPAMASPESKSQPQPLAAQEMNNQQQVTPRFELCFIRLSQDALWVCDDVSQKEKLQKLVASIMRASKQSIDAHVPIEFKWPYLETQQQDQSLSVAKRALDTQWNILVQDGVKRCFAFGEQARKWLADYEVVLLEQRLEAVLKQSNEKRQLWHALSEQQFFI